MVKECSVGTDKAGLKVLDKTLRRLRLLEKVKLAFPE